MFLKKQRAGLMIAAMNRNQPACAFPFSPEHKTVNKQRHPIEKDGFFALLPY